LRACRPGATYLDVPDDIITGKCDVDKVVHVERAPDPPRMVAPMENIEAALNLLQRAERPLVLIGEGSSPDRRNGGQFLKSVFGGFHVRVN
jgi:thiamine pyrophosphate-dependent acetolactate synthase large subunit-like protein